MKRQYKGKKALKKNSSGLCPESAQSLTIFFVPQPYPYALCQGYLIPKTECFEIL